MLSHRRARRFERRIEALDELFAFSADSFTQLGIDASLLFAIDFTLEELFTNMVKYGGSRAEIRVQIAATPGGVEVLMEDEDVDFFDVTQAPPVNTDAAIEQRRPGGLGLHLIPRIIDSIDYRYFEAERRCQIRFSKQLPQAAP